MSVSEITQISRKPLDPEIQQIYHSLKPNEAIRTLDNMDVAVTPDALMAYIQEFQDFVRQANDLVKNNIEFYFPTQFQDVLKIFNQAIEKNASNSMVLLGRSK
jgi:hypothetical protein